MKTLFFSSFFLCCITASVYSQSTTQDSLELIHQQKRALRKEQASLRAKQDSLNRIRIQLEEEQKKAARTQVVTTPKVAAPERKFKTMVGLSPLHIFITGVDLFIEHAITERSTLFFSGAYHNMENYPVLDANGSYYDRGNTIGLGQTFLSSSKVAYSGMRFQLQYRKYLFEEHPVLTKLYIAPGVVYKQDEVVIMTNHNSFTTIVPEYKTYAAEALGIGVDVGYQIKILRYFSFSPFAGFGMIIPLTGKENASKVHIDILNPYKPSMSFRTGITIGYMF